MKDSPLSCLFALAPSHAKIDNYIQTGKGIGQTWEKTLEYNIDTDVSSSDKTKY